MRSRHFITGSGLLMAASGLIAYWGAQALARRRVQSAFRDKTVFVTGGSRGLGFLLAQQFASLGAKVAISARDSDELARAEARIHDLSPDVLTIAADMTIREETEAALQKIRERFGEVDVLVNNAGVISVGPAETMTIDDYRDAINSYFWAPYFTTVAVLPAMQKRRSGRIVNISSIGGKISVPHLLPYSVGKFALTGYSEGLRSELLKDNIYVTTVCPGLMRTGSPRNALFKSNNEAEYAWFSVSDALPFISMSAARAARQIIDACAKDKAEVVLSLPAKVAVKFHGLFPGATTDLLGLINRVLPAPGGIGKDARTGRQSFSKVSPSLVTTLNEQAAKENNQIA
jgi:short-subunit dehydrogenase